MTFNVLTITSNQFYTEFQVLGIDGFDYNAHLLRVTRLKIISGTKWEFDFLFLRRLIKSLIAKYKDRS